MNDVKPTVAILLARSIAARILDDPRYASLADMGDGRVGIRRRDSVPVVAVSEVRETGQKIKEKP